MASHNELGKLGEQLAQDYLIERGYSILETNWRSGHNEIDIIAQKKELLVFVEVKSRSTTIFGQPEEAVTATKIHRLSQVAADYIEQKNVEMEIQFDIITVVKEGSGYRIEQIEDAFTPPFYAL